MVRKLYTCRVHSRLKILSLFAYRKEGRARCGNSLPSTDTIGRYLSQNRKSYHSEYRAGNCFVTRRIRVTHGRDAWKNSSPLISFRNAFAKVHIFKGKYFAIIEEKY